MTDAFTMVLDCNARYARCIDDGSLADWPVFFTGDCVYKITSAENYRADLPAGIVHAHSRAMLVDRVSALAEANIYERHSYRHLLGVPSILASDESTIRAETPFVVMRILRDGPTDVFATGRYIDVFRIDAGAVTIAERIVVCDSARIDTLLALPL